MRRFRKHALVGLFGMLFLGAGLSLGFRIQKADDRSLFLPGQTTAGHYQIELRCDACHAPFGGVTNDACNKCHGAELAAVDDAHPLSKFTDPRNAGRLESIDALHCATCHREHQPEITRPMGLTQPVDYCFHCHEDIAEDRPSHAGLAFTTCATAGCHNYHDNSALYEAFILKHLDEPDVKPAAVRPARLARRSSSAPPLTAAQRDEPRVVHAEPLLVDQWEHSGHAAADVNCSACHQPPGGDPAWLGQPGHNTCAQCHDFEVEGFLAGRHGMRLAAGLSAMSPTAARLPMDPQSGHRTLSCSSCHDAHSVDTRTAAVDSCLKCHADDHAKAYVGSEHHRLWRRELNGLAPPGSGVSCATCHLPREVHRENGEQVVRVQHNQNLNLRPAEKMLRSVCLDCHGYAFALDALADPNLVQVNFRGTPAHHLETIEMVRRRQSGEKQKNP
ncbi:MAG TPA: cytochrome c3 family protein [Opitutaceae bacterium]